MVGRGLAENLEQAKRLIMAGQVLVNEQINDKAGMDVPTDAVLRVRASLPFVSRGGVKLAAALDEFQLDVQGLVAIDVGASTGGFTDCLLQRGVRQVYAVDVGYGDFHWKLRTDARVTLLERTNIRHLAQLPAGALCDLAVVDASFISLASVLPATLRLLTPTAQIVALIKPQFEADRADVGAGGVVRDAAIHERVLLETIALADSLGLPMLGLTVSPLVGPAGNVEFLIWLDKEIDRENSRAERPINTLQTVQQVLQAATKLKQN